VILELLGCTHDSLGSYLKSLAVLRLVSQRDAEARGCWGATCFVLDSSFDREQVIDFFLTAYEPTPILAPWNGGSGFYSKDRKIGIKAILGSKEERFATFRRDLERASAIVAEVGGDRKEAKRDLVRRCRNELSDPCVDWIDAAIAIGSDEELAFAPVLGTGGNEGRLDYTNNFMERLSDLLIAPDKRTPVRALLESALFGSYTAGLQGIAVGQYDPGRAGGFNQGEKIEVDSVANPWNAVLTLEGAAGWAGGVYRKQGVAYRSFLCSPFTVRPTPVGYGSASVKDQESARAEIWTPIWSEAARWAEVRSLLREGRASVDGRPARTGLDFAQAAASLGVDRGIDRFVRFSLVKRRGDSYIALRSGQFEVKYKGAADLIRELTPSVEAATRAAKGPSGEIPNSWPPLQRSVDEAMFQALLHEREDLLVEVGAAVGAMHRWLLSRNRDVRWPGYLSEHWVRALWFKPEARVAGAMASMWSDEAGGFKDNVSPGESHFSWTGRDLAARMLSTLRRRTLDGGHAERSPFSSKLWAEKSDVVAFLENRLDEELIENLAFAFLRFRAPERKSLGHPPEEDRQLPWLRWPAYSILKQFFAASTHPAAKGPADEPRFRPDLSIAGLLQGNQVDRAIEAGLRRLRISGVRPVVTKGWSSEDGVRLGAALLIPVRGATRLRDAVTRVPEEVEV